MPQLLRPRAATAEVCRPRARTLQQEKLPQREAHAPQLESGPCLPQLEKNPCSNEDPEQPNTNK